MSFYKKSTGGGLKSVKYLDISIEFCPYLILSKKYKKISIYKTATCKKRMLSGENDNLSPK